MKCEIKKVPVCECTAKQAKSIPDLEFKIDSSTYVLPRESYVYYNDEGICQLSMMPLPI